MELLISILIVYGITNIIVAGTIFDGAKRRLEEFIKLIDSKRLPIPEDFADLSVFKTIPSNLVMAHEALTLKIADPSSQNDSVIWQFENNKNQIKAYIEKEKKSIILNIGSWLLKKIHKLVNCFMCAGFWVGAAFAWVSFMFYLSMFGISFKNLIDQNNPLLSLFISGCLFSGTTWIINVIVERLERGK